MILNLIQSSKKVLLATHIQPDGDAIGSLLSIGLALKHIGKEVTFYSQSQIPAVYRFLPAVELITNTIEPLNSYDTAIVLDCGSIERIGNLSGKIDSIPNVINIDHHITNTNFGTCQLIDSSACATTEIVYNLIKQLNIPVSLSIAYSLYTGILTDTGSFRFSNTNQSAFSICNELIESGVDPFVVAQNVYGTYSLGRIKLLNMVLDSIELSENGKLSIMSLTLKMLEETSTKSEDINGLVNYAKHIEDVRVAALIQEKECIDLHNGSDDKLFHVSLRSDGTVDVASIASTYGGGGHMSAAGFSITSTYSHVKSTIMDIASSI